MKKVVVLSLLFILLVSVSLFAGTPRGYFQKIVLGGGQDILSIVTNTGTTHCPAYLFTADIAETAGEVLSTATHVATTIRIAKTGNGTTVPYYAVAYVQLGSFTTQWVAGNTMNLSLTHIATNETATWSQVIPAGTATINITDPTVTVSPFPPAGYTLTVNSNYPGAAIWKNGSDTGQVTPYTFPVAADNDGTYTAVLANVVFPPIVVPALTENTIIRFVGVMTPDPAMTPYPADMAEIHIAHDAVATTYNLTWVAPPAGPMPTGYTLAWNGAPAVDLGNVLTWTTPAIAEGAYVWTVTPYITDPAKGTKLSLAPVKGKVTATNNSKGVCTSAVPWHFTIIRDALVVDGSVVVVIGGGTVAVGDPDWVPGVGNPIPNPAFTPTASFTLSGTGNITLTFSAPNGSYGAYWQGGAWHSFGPAVGGILTVTINFDGKPLVPFILGPVDPTLPVELSSFTAVLTAEYFVNLTWVTESETQVLGFNVYRAEDNNIANALRVNAAIIGAHNTSEQQVYTITDTEVETSHTYYYWLENVDMGGGSALHGPQSVTVTGTPPPVLPEISMLNSAYPNPFRAGQTTNISVSIKANESGTVTVYNILGQAVKTFKVTEGNHTLTWDGKGCGSGIYFYRLNTPSTNTTKKLVIVK